jgi:hypothetical protein
MTINHQHAGAFYTAAKMRGLTTAQALAELGATEFQASFEDGHFADRVPHSPTVKRLARPLISRLDAEASAAAEFERRVTHDRATFAALPESTRARLGALIAGAHGKKHNKRAREAAREAGLTVCAVKIERLRALICGEQVLP